MFCCITVSPYFFIFLVLYCVNVRNTGLSCSTWVSEWMCYEEIVWILHYCCKVVTHGEVTRAIDWLYSGASPKMRDAIQGMLSMSRGSRLLPGTALLRTQSSSSAAQLFRRRSSYPVTDDIDKKLMSCYNDNDFGEFSSRIHCVPIKVTPKFKSL